jgi:SPP1 family predicted phage head-tail adaptor
MKAGERNRRIIFERGASSQNTWGEEIPDWQILGEAWARVDHGSGQERREAAQEAATQTATFKIEWTPSLAGVKPTDRINGLGFIWDITSIIEVGYHKELHFTGVRRS